MAARIEIDQAALQRLLRDPDGPVGRDIAARTLRVHGAARRLLKTPGQGRVYVKSNPRRVHRASAPGQPPATDTGRLGASVAFEVGVDEEGIVGRVGSNLAYARHLEFGAPGARIAPRPWLRPALLAAHDADGGAA